MYQKDYRFKIILIPLLTICMLLAMSPARGQENIQNNEILANTNFIYSSITQDTLLFPTLNLNTVKTDDLEVKIITDAWNGYELLISQEIDGSDINLDWTVGSIENPSVTGSGFGFTVANCPDSSKTWKDGYAPIPTTPTYFFGNSGNKTAVLIDESITLKFKIKAWPYAGKLITKKAILTILPSI